MRNTFYDQEYIPQTVGPEKLYLEPSTFCNLNCTMCFRNSWIKKEEGNMETTLYARLSEEAGEIASLKEVFFGGMGEPLCHPEIVSMMAAFPYRLQKTLLTNGTMLNERRSWQLLEAGLTELWVSMDGFSRESYGRMRQGGKYDLITENLRQFNVLREGSGVKLGVTFVISPENIGELDSINAFADAFSVDEINLSHMIPGEPVRKEETLYDRTDISVGKMRRYAPGNDTAEEDTCPFIRSNSVFVRRDGEVIPCMQLLHECDTYLYEEKRHISAFSYGNIKDSSLMDIWDSFAYREFRYRVNEFHFPFCRYCDGCEDRKGNLTDCYLGKSPACGACLWASGKVFCP